MCTHVGGGGVCQQGVELCVDVQVGGAGEVGREAQHAEM